MEYKISKNSDNSEIINDVLKDILCYEPGDLPSGFKELLDVDEHNLGNRVDSFIDTNLFPPKIEGVLAFDFQRNTECNMVTRIIKKIKVDFFF